MLNFLQNFSDKGENNDNIKDKDMLRKIEMYQCDQLKTAILLRQYSLEAAQDIRTLFEVDSFTVVSVRNFISNHK